MFSLGAMRPHVSKILPFLHRAGGKFVEIGARDGGKESFTLYLERALGWEGLLIEPWPHLFHKCRKKRNHSTALNVAAVDQWLNDSYIEVVGMPPDVSIRAELRREAKERITGKPIKPPERNPKRRKISYVTTNSLENILQKAEFERDFELLLLNLDGYENNALEGMNFDIYKPTFIAVCSRIASSASLILPNYYEKIATSRHNAKSRLSLYRYTDYSAN